MGQRLGLVLIHDENEVNNRVIGVQDISGGGVQGKREEELAHVGRF